MLPPLDVVDWWEHPSEEDEPYRGRRSSQATGRHDPARTCSAGRSDRAKRSPRVNRGSSSPRAFRLPAGRLRACRLGAVWGWSPSYGDVGQQGKLDASRLMGDIFSPAHGAADLMT
jgi:hypothetical protein